MKSAATPHRSELRKTRLTALHRRLGAKMVNFDGWDMPVEYPSSGGLLAEPKAVRSGVGVFDVSHMGDIRIHIGGPPPVTTPPAVPTTPHHPPQLAHTPTQP